MTIDDIEALFEQPFNDLLHRAHLAHRAHFDPNKVQLSTLLSIKTGGCPEDCGYCPQSVHHGSASETLLDLEEVEIGELEGAVEVGIREDRRHLGGRRVEPVLRGEAHHHTVSGRRPPARAPWAC